jgi:RNA polymerase sigma factor (sigma-70 family)
MNSESTIFLVDDQVSVLRALSRLLRSAGLSVETFRSGQEFLQRYDANAAGCLVLDIAIPGLNGLELQQTLNFKGIELPIIFLTGHGDIPMSVQAMKRGALDFLTKPTNDEDLLSAIRAGLKRDRTNRQARAELAEIQQRLATLTPRERQVLVEVISGKLNKQVAAHLGVGEKTIKVHRARVIKKMKVQSVADLVRVTERAGIKPLPDAGRSARVG